MLASADFVCSNAANGTLCLWRSRRRHAGLVSSRVIAGDRIDAEFLADMGELFRIGEAVIHHHRSQRRQASLGEEQPWQMATNIKPHQATRNQSVGDRRQFRLASVGTTAPGLELKALGDTRQSREEDVQFAANIVPLAGGESGDHTLWRL